jgi:hypothetical protein
VTAQAVANAIRTAEGLRWSGGWLPAWCDAQG